MIHEILSQVANLPTPSAKLDFLKSNRTLRLDLIFKDALDPEITYGISSRQISVPTKASAKWTIDSNYMEFSNMLQRLKLREVTGNAAVDLVEDVIGNFAVSDQPILLKILDHDLKVGVSFDTYRSKVMGISDKFEVTLAHHLEDAKGVDVLDGSWYASRKCDGVRCITIVDMDYGTIEFISRQGKKFATLDNLKPAIEKFASTLVGKWVLDGELCKVDADGNEDFQSIMKEIRRKDYRIQECCYQLFDICAYDEFVGKRKSRVFTDRFALLLDLENSYLTKFGKLDPCWVKVLDQGLILSQADFDEWSRKVEDGNWEGFMLRHDIPFETGRTKNLLKVKKFFDAEYKVEDVLVDQLTFKEPGKGQETITCVSALVINHKGNLVKVGSGLTKEQRLSWYENPNLIIGKTICVKYFEETKNKAGEFSLRFPTLKFVYNGERDC